MCELSWLEEVVEVTEGGWVLVLVVEVFVLLALE